MRAVSPNSSGAPIVPRSFAEHDSPLAASRAGGSEQPSTIDKRFIGLRKIEALSFMKPGDGDVLADCSLSELLAKLLPENGPYSLHLGEGHVREILDLEEVELEPYDCVLLISLGRVALGFPVQGAPIQYAQDVIILLKKLHAIFPDAVLNADAVYMQTAESVTEKTGMNFAKKPNVLPFNMDGHRHFSEPS